MQSSRTGSDLIAQEATLLGRRDRAVERDKQARAGAAEEDAKEQQPDDFSLSLARRHPATREMRMMPRNGLIVNAPVKQLNRVDQPPGQKAPARSSEPHQAQIALTTARRGYQPTQIVYRQRHHLT